MLIERTHRDPSSNGDRPPTVTDDTHWWDASQIYGRDPPSPGDPQRRTASSTPTA
jgi:hypothetical protein